MSLRVKFGILLGIFGLAVAVNVATAAYTLYVLSRELEQPLRGAQSVMIRLAAVKRSIGTQHNLVSHGRDEAAIGPRSVVEHGPDVDHREQPSATVGGAPQPENQAIDKSIRDRAVMHSDRIRGELGELIRLPVYQSRVGISTSNNLVTRVERSQLLVKSWASGDEASTPDLLNDLFDLHELIEMVEGQMLRIVGEELRFADWLRGRFIFILSLSLLCAVSAGSYSVVLVRSWVLGPVARLRVAAERIGAGEFTHRVEVLGNDEIAALGRDVNTMASTLARLQDERVERERLAAIGEMTRRIVHNLRGPLSGIRTLAELTRNDVEDHSPLAENQDRIIKSVDRFEGWLAKLLRTSRPLEVVAEPHDPSAWLAEVVEACRARAESAGVHLVVESSGAPGTADFDPENLEQAVIALIDNAVDVSPPGGSVHVNCSTENEMNGRPGWFVQVSDDGPGVQESLRTKVFQPYYTSKPSGTGIGLAMVKQIATAHGGSADCRPASENGKPSGKGACFRITLPLTAVSGGQGWPRSDSNGQDPRS